MGAKKLADIVSEQELIAHISKVISGITGVQLGEKQYSLVQGRLAKRMRELRMTTPSEYAKHLNENEGIEIGVLTSLLTTHHTYFFREFSHFEFLLKTTLPRLIASHKAKGLDTIRIWSAACSRGQEVYSLAMFLKAHLPALAPGMKFEIVGSDVCEESVGLAKNGVYTWEEVKSVPQTYLQGNWSKGSGDIAAYVRAKEDLRKAVSFRVVNLIELYKHPFGALTQPKFDIIFCRNVFIYFTQQEIKNITREFIKLLNPEGNLFVGLSESLNGLDLPIEWIGPSVYLPVKGDQIAQTGVGVSKDSKPNLRVVPQATQQPIAARAPAASPQKPIRVLCVDDSVTILNLLKKILSADQGFEVVGTASDGIEAAEKAKTLRPDAITLDIHMPKASGIDYLSKFHAQVNIPVIMVSSVSRDDGNIAYRALELGASDYIEKPSLQNLKQIAEELQFKVRAAISVGASKGKSSLSLDASFKRSPVITKPEGKMRVVIANFASRDTVLEVLRQFRTPQPPTVVLVEGGGDVYKDWVKAAAAKISGAKVTDDLALSVLKQNTFTFVDFAKGLDVLKKGYAGHDTSITVFGPFSKPLIQAVMNLPKNYLIIEDRAAETPRELISKADQVVPATSFSYESDRYFADGRTAK